VPAEIKMQPTKLFKVISSRKKMNAKKIYRPSPTTATVLIVVAQFEFTPSISKK